MSMLEANGSESFKLAKSLFYYGDYLSPILYVHIFVVFYVPFKNVLPMMSDACIVIHVNK